MKVGSKGQAFAGYRMLIGVIIAFVVLIIIIGTLNYLEDFQILISENRLYTGIGNAVASPNGQTIIVENLILSEAEYTVKNLGGVSGVSPECISLFAREGDTFDVDIDRSVVVKHTIKNLNAYMRCRTSAASECAPSLLECQISFGQVFRRDWD